MKTIAKHYWIVALLAVALCMSAGCGRQSGTVKQPGEKEIAYYVDPMNPMNVSDKPGIAPCGMDMLPVYVGDKNADGIRIDPAVVQTIGVTLEELQLRDLQKEIRASGSVAVEEPKQFAVTLKVVGYVEKLFVNYTGQKVMQGDPLLELYSPELVSTQEEYLLALRDVQRLDATASEDLKTNAQQLVASTRSRLLNWDIPEQEIQALEKRGAATKTMQLRSPASGIVLQKTVTQGQQVEAGTQLYQIADLSRVWVVAEVYQQDLPYVQVNQKAVVELEYFSGKTFEGMINYISPVLDPDTKTVHARVEVKNTPDFAIKPGMFATVKLFTPIVKQVVAVPQEAIIYSGEHHIVIVALGNGYFKPVEVKCGISANGYVQNISGLQAGQKVVTSAQFLIDSESNLRAAIQQMGAQGKSVEMGGTSERQEKNAPAPAGNHTGH